MLRRNTKKEGGVGRQEEEEGKGGRRGAPVTQLGLGGSPSQHYGGKKVGVLFPALPFPSSLRKW